ncbi:adenosylcobinamide-GDP ribazoletransferase, partial [Gemmiger formicilis]|uniref:adenosylcobinamide-GDP ribazoletransferase n=1 Tax=Gemmiger formicilis TaxID=745368 RepID=UPI001FAEFDAD
YADTCDALASYADAAKKQEILKDPHCGAFALIRVCTYFWQWGKLQQPNRKVHAPEQIQDPDTKVLSGPFQGRR